MNTSMKWHNFNLSIRIKISSGAALALFVIAVFALLGLSAASKTISAKFGEAVAGLWGAISVFLAQQHGSNKLDVEAAKAGAGEKLNEIKAAAAGIAAPPCPPAEHP